MTGLQKKQLQVSIIQAFDALALASKEFKAGDWLAMELCLKSTQNALEHACKVLADKKEG